jgi:hypothetical protein
MHGRLELWERDGLRPVRSSEPGFSKLPMPAEDLHHELQDVGLCDG